MTITTDHSASSYGIPVVLDDDGEILDYAPALKLIRERLGRLTQGELAEKIGRSRRTVEAWESGRLPPGRKALYDLAEMLAAAEARA